MSKLYEIICRVQVYAIHVTWGRMWPQKTIFCHRVL